jgi:F0F1-type ATP synthase assembly protein I
MVKNLYNNEDNLYQKNDLFDKDFSALSKDQAIKLLGKNLQPMINSPWKVVILQIYLTIVFTALVSLINVKLRVDGVVISVLAGSILGVIPNIAFIMRMKFGEKSYKKSAEKFVFTLVSAEFIKITLLLIIMFVVVRNIPQLKWFPFLGMFIITLQAHWLQGLKLKFLR